MDDNRFFTRPVKRAAPLGMAIREWRMAQTPPVSQSVFAEMMNVDHAMVSRVESGTRNFGLGQVTILAELLTLDERDVALMIAGYDPALYRREIEQALWARLKAVIGPGAQEEAA